MSLVNRFTFLFELRLFLNNRMAIFYRSIKRKKFDDELVESSLVKSSSRVKGPPGIEPIRCPGAEPSSSEKKKVWNIKLTTQTWFVLLTGNVGGSFLFIVVALIYNERMPRLWSFD